MDLKNFIYGFAIGIRYTRSFRISDISGDIVDKILHGESSPFNTDFFPKIDQSGNGEKILYNPVTDNYLRVNTDDIILGIKVKGLDEFNNKFDWIIDNVVPFYVKHLFSRFNIKNIMRTGVVYYHDIPYENKKVFENFISQFTNKEVDNPEEINLAFSRKLPSVKALTTKVFDYKKLIYTFATKKSGFYANFDYQLHYNPIIEDVRESRFEELFKESKAFLDSKFYSWLSSYGK